MSGVQYMDDEYEDSEEFEEEYGVELTPEEDEAIRRVPN